MSGRWLTSKQVEIYMLSRQSGKTQAVSSAKAGISERTGREIDNGRRKPPGSTPRHWRTRNDPFSSVWSEEIESMLQGEPTLSPLTLLEYLQDKHGEEAYPDKLLRTLQRRVRHWRYEKGPDKEVIFRQEHAPGVQGLSDFTTLKGITVTIQGQPFTHLLYHFRLMYSGWSYMQVVLGGESYCALAEGLQHALWMLGGSPKEHRTDSLSAAYKNLTAHEQDDLTQQYRDLCSHYQMIPSRNNRGVSHENGGIESPHGHLKRRIKQAFLLRGSYDFEDMASYQQWLNEVVRAHNRRNARTVDVEKATLQALPQDKTQDYTVLPVKVSTSSTIQVRTSLYSVPSRLMGATLKVHLYHDRLECFLGSSHVLSLDRVYGEGKKRRAKRIDYRHVIQSLIKKPMAFYKSQHRDAFLPNETYQHIWSGLCSELPAQQASRLMVGILHLAATADCEQALGEVVHEALYRGDIPILSELQDRFNPRSDEVGYLAITATQHTLSSYDMLLSKPQEVQHAFN